MFFCFHTIAYEHSGDISIGHLLNKTSPFLIITLIYFSIVENISHLLEDTVISWTRKLSSLTKQDGNFNVTVRANRPVSEDIIVHWSADCATEWAKYEALKGGWFLN